LAAEKKPVHVGGLASVDHAQKEIALARKEAAVRLAVDLGRQVEARLDAGRVAVAGAVAIEIAQLGDRHVVPREGDAHAADGGAAVAVSVRPILERFLDRLALAEEWRRGCIHIYPYLVGERL